MLSPLTHTCCTSRASCRYHNNTNHVKVHTSEQVKQLVTVLSEETDDNNKFPTPFKFTDNYDDMYAQLMLKDKPVLSMNRQTDIITLTGKVWPLELFLHSLGFVKFNSEMVITTSSAEAHGGFDAITADVRALAHTYGWKIEV